MRHPPAARAPWLEPREAHLMRRVAGQIGFVGEQLVDAEVHQRLVLRVVFDKPLALQDEGHHAGPHGRREKAGGHVEPGSTPGAWVKGHRVIGILRQTEGTSAIYGAEQGFNALQLASFSFLLAIPDGLISNA